MGKTVCLSQRGEGGIIGFRGDVHVVMKFEIVYDAHEVASIFLADFLTYDGSFSSSNSCLFSHF